MSNRTLLSALTAAAAFALVTPAVHAQDTTKKDTARVESRGDVAIAPTFQSLISAISRTDSATATLKASTAVEASNVHVVNAAPLLQGDNEKELQAAITTNKASIEGLRSTIGANATLKAALDNPVAPIAVTDIVAADVNPAGMVTLDYWKSPVKK
jgi:hypothetical protein